MVMSPGYLHGVAGPGDLGTAFLSFSAFKAAKADFTSPRDLELIVKIC